MSKTKRLSVEARLENGEGQFLDEELWKLLVADVQAVVDRYAGWQKIDATMTEEL